MQETGKILGTTDKEIEIFIGIILKMGIVKMNSVRDYWSTSIGFDWACDISRNRFELLCRYVHFVDNSSEIIDKSDKVWKLRPWLDSFKMNCQSIDPEEHQSVDEVSIPYKGKKCSFKLYNPSKPEWHIKLFGRAGSSGILYDFWRQTNRFTSFYCRPFW